MRKRKLLLGALAGLLVLAGSGAFLALRPAPPSRVTRENYDCIKAGMTEAEVEAILGPEGDYRSGPTDRGPRTEEILLPEPLQTRSRPTPYTSRWGHWQGDNGQIDVGYNAEKAVMKRFFPCQRVEQFPLGNLRWQAERQW